MKKEEIERIATDAYFMKADMVKFLLVENLALKTLLLEKDLISAEEYKEHQRRAAELLEEKTKAQIAQHLKEMLSRTETHGNGKL
jgi:hypothetical protein